MKQNSKLRIFTKLPNSTYVLAAVFLLASIFVPKFLSPGNLSTLLTQASILMVLSLAMSMCLTMGSIDLSMGGVLSMSGVVMAMCLSYGLGGGLSILCGLLCGAGFGAINGFVVGKLKVAPFIATFGTAGIAQSLANTLSGKRTVFWEATDHNKIISLLGKNVVSFSFTDSAAGTFSLSVLFCVAAVVALIVVLVFKKTPLGSHIYALGENEETARLASINTTSLKVGIYMLSGLLAAVAGCIVMVRTNSLQPTVGDGLEFQAIVAAVLGGTSMKGGKGSLVGAILGAFTLYTVRNSLSLWGIDTSVVMVAIGLILVLGMVLNQAMAKFWDKRGAKEEAKP